ncbi:50S ribosomal protein L14e [Caloramator mitchellensis]|uniref:50S ribosomal protein L14e n=1 Tax=Caloramator mitchellensis TaxID=908809 RepID=A0A0R3K1Y6_CALMK|nr:KOW domain-containing RNA-binding protein [Caloramator mitchellensis]KRQ87276.1 50S ribosomal protein L14e [Caloramator mitchellensis]
MEGIALGQLVHSRAGRDKNRYFIIVGLLDENYVLIADGDLRKFSKPKKKKIKHLVFHDKFADDIRNALLENKRITDADIRKSLQSMGLL